MGSLLLAATEVGGMGLWVLWWLIAMIGAIAGLVYAYRFYADMKKSDPGDSEMVRIAGYVTEGAKAYLSQQYRVVAIVFLVIAGIFAILAFGFEVQSRWVPLAFLTGGFFSALAGYFGMMTATAASSRTAAAARTSLNGALKVAFRSGAVMGLVVVGLGLLNVSLWFVFLYFVLPSIFGQEPMSLDQLTTTLLSAGLGASTQALFARVGGGIFTKSADVGADLVGKVEANIPEDDPRNPAVIADNVGDNVGDVAGMGADLFESYCGSILAAAALAVPALSVYAGGSFDHQMAGILLPFAISGIGVLVSIYGVYTVRTKEGATQQELLGALNRGMNLASGLGAFFGFLLTPLLLGFTGQYWLLGCAILVGALSGALIAWWTGISTSAAFGPTQRIVNQAEYGPATVIISGIAEGMSSTWAPTIIVGIGTIVAFGCGTGFDFSDPELISMGLYGIGISAVGMLSTLGILLATDAYGPIADNAGGNAEMTKQDPSVREKTDALDSLGNTTAAIGKGFAIASAALTALALLAAYVEQVRVSYVQLADTKIKENERLETSDPDAYDKWREATEPGSDGFPLREGSGVVIGRNLDGLEESDAEAALQPYVRFDKDPRDKKDEFRFVPVKQATIRDFVDLLGINPLNPKLLVGILVGAMLVCVFTAMTMSAVGRSAGKMVAEVRRQFREIPGLMEGTGQPDYASCVKISTRAAQYEMMAPSILGISGPVLTGLLLGVPGVVGLLAGATATGFMMAIMMANAGGAWDNAKKYIESGEMGGKGSPAHKAAVVGDTVGDPFKDTSGPSLNILIKLMSMISVVFTAIVLKYSL